ncbi:hypothetical protein TWF225_002579 [Orbilia oligospora]|nr:hypothetical protein TWF225_002579 [Orbilia oligospora]KAF3266172.1 hypothetical protein TWF217_001852 [Orbilia oligospora]KAF3268718.1 hypothetical protein TWF128_007088 [Orbilia oligospora]
MRECNKRNILRKAAKDPRKVKFATPAHTPQQIKITRPLHVCTKNIYHSILQRHGFQRPLGANHTCDTSREDGFCGILCKGPFSLKLQYYIDEKSELLAIGSIITIRISAINSNFLWPGWP